MFANALVNIGNAGGGAQAVAVHPSKHACDGNKRKLEECFARSLEKSPAIKGVLAGAGDEFYRRSEFVLANRAYVQSLKTLVPLEEGAEESSDDEGATDSIAVRTFAPMTEAGEEDKGFFAAPLTAKNAQIRNDDLSRACLTGMVMIQVRALLPRPLPYMHHELRAKLRRSFFSFPSLLPGCCRAPWGSWPAT